ncbi:MAG: hypothetical protein IPK78_06890 [Rhodospirillales bacterium]|nr:hypothetical protein [Rhodospirillales bacterium]
MLDQRFRHTAVGRTGIRLTQHHQIHFTGAQNDSSADLDLVSADISHPIDFNTTVCCV